MTHRIVIGVGPRAVLLERLGDAHLEVEAAAAHLPRHLGAREGLELGKVLVEEGLARLEGFGIPGPAGGAGRVLDCK